MGRFLAMLVVCAGCRTDLADWEVSRVDGMEFDRDEKQILAAGVWLQLALQLQSHESNHYYAPANVRWVIDHPNTLEVTLVGEIEGELFDYTQVDLRASQLGPNRIRFISDDTDEPLTLSFNAVAQ